MYTQFISRFLFPLQERLKQHTTVAVHKHMEKTQWWPWAQLRELQLQRLRELLLSANAHVPYYHALFARLQFDPAKVDALEALRVLPFLNKDLIRAHAEELKAENARALAPFNTGGSSGEPLTFYIGQRVSHDVAAKWRATRWWGVDIGDPEIVLWGSPIELGAQDRLRAFRDKLLRSTLLPAFEMSEPKMDAFVSTIERIKPRMLFGYPSSLALLAKHARNSQRRLDHLGIKVAFVTAERLYEDQKNIITDVFACRVANGYGARDAGFIAHECPQGKMHITAEDVIVEIIDSEGNALPPGKLGEIVITHLATADFPFIRYRTGDMGVLDDALCTCGRGLPLLKEVEGRATDFVVAANGTVMHGLALIYPLRAENTIRAFKIIQESLLKTRVQIVPGEGWDTQVQQRIAQAFHARLGSEVRVDVELMDAIPAERSGKFRYVMSHVDPDNKR